MTIEQELSNLTKNFTDENVAVRCYTVEEKQAAMRIFREHYDVVEVSDGRQNNDDRMSYVITCANPKKGVTESLNEAEEEPVDDDVTEDEFDDLDDEEPVDDVEAPTDDIGDDEDLDLSLDDFDDPDDDLDLQDQDFDTIDDMSEVDKADKLTILKKRAADLSKKWKDTFNEIAELARQLDLIATHDEDFKIDLKKSDGTDSKYEQDLDNIETDIAKEIVGDDDLDDDFGPSKYDARASEFSQEPEPIQQESIDYNPQSVQLVEGTDNKLCDVTITNPGELPIREDEIDDDF